MNLIINDDNLQVNEIVEFNSKVRAVLIDEKNRVLIARYDNVLLFPGGSIDDGENIDNAIIRELKEETGTIYEKSDLSFLTKMDFFQKNYVKRNGKIQNRLISTYYFLGAYKPIKLQLQCLTEKEKKDGFKLELVPLEQLEKLVLKNQNDNPRNIYFQREILEIIRLLINKFKENNCTKKLKYTHNIKFV